MTGSPSAALIAAAVLAGGLLVFSGFRLYRVALACVGAAAGAAAGWLVGSFPGSVEVAAASALVGGVAGALLVGPLEAVIRFVVGGLAAAGLAGVALGGPEPGIVLSTGVTAGAFLAGGVATLLLYRPLVVSAFAVCGGLAVAGAGAVALDPGLLEPTLGGIAGSVAEALRADLAAALVVVGGSVAAALALQAGDGPPGPDGRRGVRSGGVLLTALLAAGLAFTLDRPDAFPGPALAITGVGPLSWPVAILLLRPVAALARRGGGAARGGARVWALAALYGLAVGLSDALLAGAAGATHLPETRFVAAFTGGSTDLLLVKAGWSLAAFPLLFAAAVRRSAGNADPEG